MHSHEQIKTGQMNAGIRAFWTPNWIHNAAENKSFMEEMYHERGDKMDLASMPRPPVGPNGERVPCLILGSGPSFERALPHLRFWRGAIIATPSHARILDVWKRPADYILALDTSTRVPDQLGTVEFHGTNLITHPSMCPELFKKWKWRDHMYIFRMFEPENEIMNALYDSLFPMIRAKVINSGCVANNAMIIANNLGYSPIFLVGVDFGYPTPRNVWTAEELYEEARPKRQPGETDEMFGLRLQDWEPADKRFKENPESIYELKGIFPHHLDQGWLRFRDYVDIGKYVYEPKPLELETDNSPQDYKKAEMPDGSTCLTTPTNIFYRTTLMANWKMMHYPIVNCSYGILRATEIPFCHIEEVIQKQGQGMATKEGDPYYMNWKQIDEAADRFTIPRGLYAKYGFVNGTPVIRGIEITDSIITEKAETTFKLDMINKLGDLWSFNDETEEWSRKIRPEDDPAYVDPAFIEAVEATGTKVESIEPKEPVDKFMIDKA